MRVTTDTPASGFQIAFLIVAALFLGAPADKYLSGLFAWATELGIPVSKLMALGIGGAVLFGIPKLRRICVRLLSQPIPRTAAPELGALLLLHLLTTLGALGMGALWLWIAGGETLLAVERAPSPEEAKSIAQATSIDGILFAILGTGMLAPLVEDLAFRGLLYPAWARQWGWIRSAIATSLLFAIFHPNKISQFFGSLLSICIYRRTGSLWSCIVLHAAFNILVWYPLLGQFVLPAGRETGELRVWAPHLACAAITLVAIPVYMWMSRDGKAAPMPATRLETNPRRT